MIRSVAYLKAVMAGMAGAVVWEIIDRALIWSRVPFFDIVNTLGTVVLPQASPWPSWAVGFVLHLVVGAIWAVFYAYFFWSVLPVRPIFQGLAFAFVPLPLAIFVMRPQLDLMNPLVPTNVVSSSGLFGLDGGILVLASVVIGHFIWGAVLGALYTHPVGFPANRLPRLRIVRGGSGPAPVNPPGASVERFIFATGIECSYPTLEGGRWRMDQMAACGHYRRWRTDLELVRDLGLRNLRYGPPLHLIHQGPGRYDWCFLDEVADGMQRLDIVPIMDLCHFGLPDWLQNFQNPEVPHALANYARAFARRYPWVRFYTPVNEMYVCAKLSALEGVE